MYLQKPSNDCELVLLSCGSAHQVKVRQYYGARVSSSASTCHLLLHVKHASNPVPRAIEAPEVMALRSRKEQAAPPNNIQSTGVHIRHPSGAACPKMRKHQNVKVPRSASHTQMALHPKVPVPNRWEAQ